MVLTPPAVSIPSERGATSRRRRSLVVDVALADLGISEKHLVVVEGCGEVRWHRYHRQSHYRAIEERHREGGGPGWWTLLSPSMYAALQ
jgi:hypothetical protein